MKAVAVCLHEQVLKAEAWDALREGLPVAAVYCTGERRRDAFLEVVAAMDVLLARMRAKEAG